MSLTDEHTTRICDAVMMAALQLSDALAPPGEEARLPADYLEDAIVACDAVDAVAFERDRRTQERDAGKELADDADARTCKSAAQGFGREVASVLSRYKTDAGACRACCRQEGHAPTCWVPGLASAASRMWNVFGTAPG